jgi:hypothetical protein
MLTIPGLNLFGDGLRDPLDPKVRGLASERQRASRDPGERRPRCTMPGARAGPGEPSPRGDGEDQREAAVVMADILEREGVQFPIGYPVNQIIEAAAEADIRTIILRQERTGLHMADAVSRVTSGGQIGVFAMQHGPGTETRSMASPRPTATPCHRRAARRLSAAHPRHPAKLQRPAQLRARDERVREVVLAENAAESMRRAVTQVANGRQRPVLVEAPVDLLGAEVPDGWTCTPASGRSSRPARARRRCWGSSRRRPSTLSMLRSSPLTIRSRTPTERRPIACIAAGACSPPCPPPPSSWPPP